MIAQRIVLTYTTQIIVQIVQIISTMIVARIVGPSVLGTVAFGLAYASFFKFLSDFGLNTAHIRIAAEGKDLEDGFKTFKILKIASIFIFIILVTLTYLLQKFIFQYEFETKEQEFVLIISLFVVAVGYYETILTSDFASRMQQAKQDIPHLVSNVYFSLAKVAVAFSGGRSISLALTNLSSVVLSYSLLKKYFPSKLEGRFNARLARRYIGISFPFLLTGLMASVMSTFDTIVLQYFSNSTEVGIYSISFRFGMFIKMIGMSVAAIFLPLFTRSLQSLDYISLNNKISQYERFSLKFLLPVVLLISITSDFWINIFLGGKFGAAAPIFSIINIAMFLIAVYIPYSSIYNASGRLKKTIVFVVIQVIVFIISLFVFVSPWVFNMGALGAAVSLLSANLVLAILFIFFVKKDFTGIIVFPGVKSGVLGLAVALLGFTLYQFINNVLLHYLFILAFLPFYYLVAHATGICSKDDWLELKNLLRLDKLLDYIKTELKADK